VKRPSEHRVQPHRSKPIDIENIPEHKCHSKQAGWTDRSGSLSPFRRKLDLGERGVLDKRKKGKQTVFVAPADLSARLLKLEKEAGAWANESIFEDTAPRPTAAPDQLQRNDRGLTTGFCGADLELKTPVSRAYAKSGWPREKHRLPDEQAGRLVARTAFDVTYSYNPTGSWTAPHQMSVNGKQDGFSLEDFERCAKSALMKRGRATTIIEEVQGLGMRRLETSTARPKSGRGLPHSMSASRSSRVSRIGAPALGVLRDSHGKGGGQIE
jgi:hypothetical protein